MEGSAHVARPDGSPGALALRRLRRHWGLLAVCVGFLLMGALVLDDFGPVGDSVTQRDIGRASLDYVLGDGGRAFDRLERTEVNRFYGVAVELPLVLVERVLGLDDSRDIWRSRHFLTHLFFLAGGVCCYLLVLRMFGSRLLALIAMALFLLLPRLYAHSFYNSKDVPFAAMFMIALYLVHRAFRRDTLAAFLLCGAGVGVLVNLRAMGLILLVAVLALRALDLLFAGGKGERKRILLAGGAFASGATLTYYAVFPGIWADPFGGFMNALQVASRHPTPVYNLFRGEWLFGPDGPPFEYIPVWMGITTPPVVLLLAVVGVAALCWRTVRHPRDLWRATPLRFHLLLVLLIVGTIVAVFVARSSIYNGWRHVYFLYAPLAVLSALGLHWLLSCADRRWMRAGIHALAGAGVAVALVSMVGIHPMEDNYFNSLVDRTTPEYLVSRYEADYWQQSHYGITREILEDHPEQNIFSHIWLRKNFWFSEKDRERMYGLGPVFVNGFYSDRPVSDRYYTSKLYNTTIKSFKGVHISPENVEKIIRSARSMEPLDQSYFFDIHFYENALVYIKESCKNENIGSYFLHIYPEIQLPYYPDERYTAEFINRDFWLYSRDIDENMRCFAITILPDISIRNIHTGRKNGIWITRFGFTLPNVDPGIWDTDAVVNSMFDVWHDDDMLIYARDGCTFKDADALFFLHVVPFDPDDMPAGSRQYGFENRDFSLWDAGNRVGDRCVATVALPDYPIARVRTGQYDGTGRLWAVEFALATVAVDPAVLANDPLASAAFDVYRDGDSLVYVRDGCTEGDVAATFFLHIIPVDVDDLPAARRRYGFDNRDFTFATRGRVDGDCVAAVPLPHYAIASIRTGQYDEAGERWSVEFALPDGE